MRVSGFVYLFAVHAYACVCVCVRVYMYVCTCMCVILGVDQGIRVYYVDVYNICMCMCGGICCLFH